MNLKKQMQDRILWCKKMNAIATKVCSYVFWSLLAIYACLCLISAVEITESYKLSGALEYFVFLAALGLAGVGVISMFAVLHEVFFVSQSKWKVFIKSNSGLDNYLLILLMFLSGWIVSNNGSSFEAKLPRRWYWR